VRKIPLEICRPLFSGLALISVFKTRIFVEATAQNIIFAGSTYKNFPEHSAMKLNILVGSTTGTAGHVAQAIQLHCADLVTDVHIESMDGLDINIFDAEKSRDTLYLVCTSTYGAGDVPDNAQAFYESLAAQPRFLGHVLYGVLGLGDSCGHPQTFCLGGKKFDERLQDLGARRLGEIFCLDDASGIPPEVAGAEWCNQWLKDFSSQAAVQPPG
jgi:MioC protein